MEESGEAFVKYTMRTVVYVYFGTPIILFALASNVLSLAIFLRDRATNPSTRLILISLTLANGLTLFFEFFQGPVQYFSTGHLNTLLPYDNLFLSFMVIVGMVVMSGIRSWLFIIVALERYICLSPNVRFRRLWTRRRVRIMCCVLVILVLIFRIPAMACVIFYDFYGGGALPTRRTMLVHCTFDTIVFGIIPMILLVSSLYSYI